MDQCFKNLTRLKQCLKPAKKLGKIRKNWEKLGAKSKSDFALNLILKLWAILQVEELKNKNKTQTHKLLFSKLASVYGLNIGKYGFASHSKHTTEATVTDLLHS